MSYNIDSIEIVYSKDFRIESDVRLDDLAVPYADAVPEGNIFENRESCFRGTSVVRFDWHGEGSGRAYAALVKVLAEFNGEADLVLTWEGGDSFTGLRLRDHKVTKHKVLMTLGPEEKS